MTSEWFVPKNTEPLNNNDDLSTQLKDLKLDEQIEFLELLQQFLKSFNKEKTAEEILIQTKTERLKHLFTNVNLTNQEKIKSDDKNLSTPDYNKLSYFLEKGYLFEYKDPGEKIVYYPTREGLKFLGKINKKLNELNENKIELQYHKFQQSKKTGNFSESEEHNSESLVKIIERLKLKIDKFLSIIIWR